MIDNEIKQLTCNSKEYYKNITSIDVIPVREVDMSKYLLHRKGDTIVKKRLFRQPITKEIKEDVYKSDGCKYNAIEFARIRRLLYDASKNKFFIEGRVEIHGKHRETRYFSANKELKEFVEDLRQKCEKCDNELL